MFIFQHYYLPTYYYLPEWTNVYNALNLSNDTLNNFFDQKIIFTKYVFEGVYIYTYIYTHVFVPFVSCITYKYIFMYILYIYNYIKSMIHKSV